MNQSLKSIDEKIKLLNQTDCFYDKNTTILELFEQQVRKEPEKTALIFNREEMTYRKLNEKANCLARTLRQKGVKPNAIVAVIADRSFEMMIGVFAVLKAGGAYLPIPPKTPLKRMQMIIDDSGVQITLIQQQHIQIDLGNVQILNLNDVSLYKGPADDLTVVHTPEDLAYVIFTSGSTGKPKGTMIEHHSLINRLAWMQKKYPIDRNDTLLQKTPFGFDVSVWELFWWAMTGSRLCLLAPGFEIFPQAIVDAVEKHRVSVIHFVPSMLNAFLNYLKPSNDLEKLSALKQVFASGETLTANQVRLFKQTIFKHHGTKLTNLYGPTEATIDVSYYDCRFDTQIPLKIPIGKPIDNTKLFIASHNELQDTEEIGELCISGVGLAAGYLGRADLTQEKFVPSLLNENERMYRTGDLAKILTNGNIEYHGRIDNQVKINGLRIELEEIEVVLSSHPGIDQCAAVIENKEGELPRMAAFYSLIGHPDHEPVGTKDFIAYLKDFLPEYMVPNLFCELVKFPLNQNGKIDRKALAVRLREQYIN